MRTTVLLIAIALFIAIPGPTTAAQYALSSKELVPLRFENHAYGPLTVKLVGPTRKTFRLSSGENLVVLVNPGEFQCFYRYQSQPRDQFKKTEKFPVPEPRWDKPNDGFALEFWDDSAFGNSPRKPMEAGPSSLKEFNAADGSALPPAEIDHLRFNNLDVVIVLETVIESNDPDADQKKIVLAQFNQYFRNVLFPKLGRLGIKVQYLGVREAFDENSLTAPMLVINYKEDTGRRYAWGPARTPVSGVDIDCSLALYYPGISKGQGIWSATLHEENDESLKGSILADPEELLHNQVLRYLRAELNELEFDLADWGPKQAPGAAAPRPPSRRRKN